MHSFAYVKVFIILNDCLYFYLHFLLCYSRILSKTSQKFTRNRSGRRRMLLRYWLSVLKMRQNIKFVEEIAMLCPVPPQDRVLVQSPEDTFK